jgi:hypothetical protein
LHWIIVTLLCNSIDMPSSTPKPRESLADLFPEIAAEWHPTKNDGLFPEDVSKGSNRKIWWKCSLADDHEWVASPHARTGSKSGCLCCRGYIASVTNSLASLFPEVSAQWHPDKNGDLTPDEVVAGSRVKYWWKCPVAEDHEWRAVTDSRTRGKRGCPFCRGVKVSGTNRLSTNFPVVSAQWHPDKNGDLTPDQVALGSGRKVWWKCDEGSDHEWMANVAERTNNNHGCPFCANRKVSVTNSLSAIDPLLASEWHPVLNGGSTPAQVLAGSGTRYWWKCREGPDHEWVSSCHNRRKGNGCPFCRNLKISVTNKLSIQDPVLASQWHPTKNGNITPENVTSYSSVRYWWKCAEGPDHEWKSTPYERSHQDSGCPYCSGFKLSITNSLSRAFPVISKEWHPTKNGELVPSKVLGGTHKKVWWKCSVADDHEWRASVASRTSAGRRCPACAGKQVSTTNRLDLLFPHIASEWHPTKNEALTPDEVTFGSKKRVWWKCSVSEDHEWVSNIGTRTLRGSGCTYCTLTPRSAQEIRLAHELSSLLGFDVDAHKVRFAGRLRDVDILLEEVGVVVEFDGAYWHENKAEKDLIKTQQMEEAGWIVIRVRERPLESIHKHDVMVETLAPAKTVAGAVSQKIVDICGVDIPRLEEYLASDGPWREKEASAAIREYLASRAAKKTERDAKRAAKKSSK